MRLCASMRHSFLHAAASRSKCSFPILQSGYIACSSLYARVPHARTNTPSSSSSTHVRASSNDSSQPDAAAPSPTRAQNAPWEQAKQSSSSSRLPASSQHSRNNSPPYRDSSSSGANTSGRGMSSGSKGSSRVSSPSKGSSRSNSSGPPSNSSSMSTGRGSSRSSAGSNSSAYGSSSSSSSYNFNSNSASSSGRGSGAAAQPRQRGNNSSQGGGSFSNSNNQPPGEPSPLLVQSIKRMKEEQAPVRPVVDLIPLSEEFLKFFADRHIQEDTLRHFKVQMAPQVYCPALKRKVDAIAFPYHRNGELVNVKYRALPKTFWQEKNAEKILYGYDEVVKAHGPQPKELIIVEGEMDVLALNQVGITNVVSVPDGAPAVARPLPAESASPLSTTKFSYLGNCWSLLEGAQKFVIATDNDNPGNALAEELMRRLNRELCWRVKWSRVGPPPAPPPTPAAAATDEGESLTEGDSLEAEEQQLSVGGVAEAGSREASVDVGEERKGVLASSSSSPDLLDSQTASELLASAQSLAAASVDSSYRKDGNDVLIRDGPEAVKERVLDAEPSPIVGLYRFNSYLDEILSQYHNMDDQGVVHSTGWDNLDTIYKVVLGEVNIVSGVPNSGKSEWIDALLMNLALHHGMAFALCSLEKTPDKHAIQLIEKVVEKPFYDRWDYDNQVQDENGQMRAPKAERMTEAEVVQGLHWINERFHIISNSGNDFPTIDWILEKARAAVLRHGIHGLVIDPYNEINHARSRDMNETEYVSIMMSKVKRFAQAYDVAVWFVAHPRQQQAWTGSAPDMYCISGSANFVNKADNVIMVHRPYQPKAGFGQDKGSKKLELLPNEVQIFMCKVRNKLAGTRSEVPARLCYDRMSGRYFENPSQIPPRRYISYKAPSNEIAYDDEVDESLPVDEEEMGIDEAERVRKKYEQPEIQYY